MKPFEPGVQSKHPLLEQDEIWLNDKYQVNIRHGEHGMTWLSIKRLDKESIHDWRDLQLIKNMLCDPEREACEIYPAESRLVDSSNQYHLWVLPEGERFPFGYGERFVVKGHKGGYHKGSGQRDFNPNEEPTDAFTKEDAEKLTEEFVRQEISRSQKTLEREKTT